jgi:hypothetical protein
LPRQIEFYLPDVSMPRELLALHLPNPERVKVNLRSLAEQSRGLSGGEILNAIHAGSRDPDPVKWMVTEEMMLREVRCARAAKEKHGGLTGRQAEDRIYGLTDFRFSGSVLFPPNFTCCSNGTKTRPPASLFKMIASLLIEAISIELSPL